MNNATFAGRVGRDAILRKTQKDESVSNFSLAVDRFKKDSGPLWISVSLWGKSADNLTQYIKKGKQLVVSGEVDLRTYDKDGEQRTELVCNARQVTLMGGAEKGREPGDDDGFGG